MLVLGLGVATNRPVLREGSCHQKHPLGSLHHFPGSIPRWIRARVMDTACHKGRRRAGQGNVEAGRAAEDRGASHGNVHLRCASNACISVLLRPPALRGSTERKSPAPAPVPLPLCPCPSAPALPLPLPCSCPCPCPCPCPCHLCPCPCPCPQPSERPTSASSFCTKGPRASAFPS